jgi:hypothetical protein
VTHAEIKQTDFLHIRELCERIREREAKVLEQLGTTAEHYVTQEVAKSLQSWTGLINDEVVCMWGVQTAGPLAEDAYVWLVCSEALTEYPRTFLRHSHEALETIKPLFKRIYGLVFSDFEKSSRWLEWLGFSVAPPDNKGVRFFEMRN